jgi:predicted anti-sigma-YlaC factor YlaD
MSDEQICPQESRVLQARREGRWSEDLAAHLAACPSCREAERVATWMRRLAVVPTEKSLPDADMLWMMAQASRPERLHLNARFLESLGALTIAAVLMALAWSVVHNIIGNLVPAGAMDLVPLLVSCVAASGLAIVAISSGIFREE